MGTVGPGWQQLVNMCHQPEILNFVIMTLLLLEQQQSHDHKLGGERGRPVWDDCPG
jgi:hypothetical protein